MVLEFVSNRLEFELNPFLMLKLILELILSCFVMIKIQADAIGSSWGRGHHRAPVCGCACMNNRWPKGYYKQCNCNLYSTYAINQLSKLGIDHVMKYLAASLRSPTERVLRPGTS